MTAIVGAVCNGRWSCSFKAPTEDEYKRKGVQARTRSFCTQGMEITYQCGHNDFHTEHIAGDAWNNRRPTWCARRRRHRPRRTSPGPASSR